MKDISNQIQGGAISVPRNLSYFQFVKFLRDNNHVPTKTTYNESVSSEYIKTAYKVYKKQMQQTSGITQPSTGTSGANPLAALVTQLSQPSKPSQTPAVSTLPTSPTPALANITQSINALLPKPATAAESKKLTAFEQIWLDLVNSIDISIQNKEFDTSNRQRLKKLTFYDMSKVLPYINRQCSMIEDAPLSFEMLTIYNDPTFTFPGKRQIGEIHEYTIGNRAPWRLPMAGRFYRVLIPDENQIRHLIGNVHDRVLSIIAVARSASRFEFYNINNIHVNDLCYNKNQLHDKILNYGSLLTQIRLNNRNYPNSLNMTIFSSANLGDTIEEFYKQIDTNYFNQLNTGLSSHELNPSRLLNTLRGMPQPSVAQNFTQYTTELDDHEEAQDRPYSIRPLPTQEGAQQGVSEHTPSNSGSDEGSSSDLMSRFVGFNVMNLPSREYPHGLQVGDFVMHNNAEARRGYTIVHEISKVTDRTITIASSRDGVIGNRAMHLYTNLGLCLYSKVMFTSNNPSHTIPLRDIWISQDSTYKQFYLKHKDAILNYSAPEDYPTPRPVSRQLKLEDTPNTPLQTQGAGAVMGGDIDPNQELDLWRMMFNPNSIINLGDVGNGQKMYVMQF